MNFYSVDTHSPLGIDKKDLNNILFDSRLFYSAGIKTIRDVYRLVNSFLISYDLLKREVILSDLLNLELLRIKYLGVYELLANKTDHFLRSKENSSGVLILSSVRDKNSNKICVK